MIRNTLKLGLVALALTAVSFPAMAAPSINTDRGKRLTTRAGSCTPCCACPYVKASKPVCTVKPACKPCGVNESRGNRN